MIYIIALILLIILLLIGVPVPFVFLSTTIFLIFTLGYDASFLIPYGFSQLNNTVLLAIPLFIIAGGVMSIGGIGKGIVDFANLFVGKIRGGLGIVTIIACALFGAMSGSAAAALTSIGAVMFPRLKEKGYPDGFAASLLSSASILGLLIPPSAIMILYAWVGNQSVLASFLATVGPGIILIILLTIINLIEMRKHPMNPIPVQSSTVLEQTEPMKKEKASKILLFALPGLFMPILVLGSIYGGFMTPTEAAAISVVYAIPVGLWIYKAMNRKQLFKVLVTSGTTTGVIMVMLYSTIILSRIIVMENIPSKLTTLLLALTENVFFLMLLINAFLIIIGMLMDDVSAVLLSTPLLLPIVINLGIDPIHFAAILGVNLGMGLLTPPTAPLLFLGSREAKTPINKMLKPTITMLLFAWLPTLLITTYFPSIALFLPNLLLGK